jgi:hypothetical protein
MKNFPTKADMDVERYRQLRQLGRRLMSVLAETIPREAIQEMGNALGIMRKNKLIFDTLDVSSVLMDSCLFDWIRGGKNLVEKYVEAYPPALGTDEHFLLQGYCRAKYRLLLTRAISPGTVTYWLDPISGKSIALMDISLSQSMARGFRELLATRTVPLGGYWITRGAPLPVGDRKTGEMLLTTIRRGNLLEDTTSADEHKQATAIIRACLDSGAAEHVRCESGEEEEKELAKARSTAEVKSQPCDVDRNDPCPCGSGKRYRRCCMRKQLAPPWQLAVNPACLVNEEMSGVAALAGNLQDPFPPAGATLF